MELPEDNKEEQLMIDKYQYSSLSEWIDDLEDKLNKTKEKLKEVRKALPVGSNTDDYILFEEIKRMIDDIINDKV